MKFFIIVVAVAEQRSTLRNNLETRPVSHMEYFVYNSAMSDGLKFAAQNEPVL